MLHGDLHMPGDLDWADNFNNAFNRHFLYGLHLDRHDLLHYAVHHDLVRHGNHLLDRHVHNLLHLNLNDAFNHPLHWHLDDIPAVSVHDPFNYLFNRNLDLMHLWYTYHFLHDAFHGHFDLSNFGYSDHSLDNLFHRYLDKSLLGHSHHLFDNTFYRNFNFTKFWHSNNLFDCVFYRHLNYPFHGVRHLHNLFNWNLNDLTVVIDFHIDLDWYLLNHGCFRSFVKQFSPYRLAVQGTTALTIIGPSSLHLSNPDCTSGD
mmetsp:Transcript_7554/g.13340  ORF Transcript_7554/g.13340 Transcript_7554/m.13340 type:complete len:259 (+) Transcript_7554:816-1592(+)